MVLCTGRAACAPVPSAQVRAENGGFIYVRYAQPRRVKAAGPGAAANGAGLSQGPHRPLLRSDPGFESVGLLRRQSHPRRRAGGPHHLRLHLHQPGRMDPGRRLYPLLHGHPPARGDGVRHFVRRLLLHRQDHCPELRDELLHFTVVHALRGPRHHRLLPLQLRPV